MCENHELSTILAFFAQNLHSERRRVCSGGAGGVPEALFEAVCGQEGCSGASPGGPWGENVNILVGF